VIVPLGVNGDASAAACALLQTWWANCALRGPGALAVKCRRGLEGIQGTTAAEPIAHHSSTGVFQQLVIVDVGLAILPQLDLHLCNVDEAPGN
jgi:hypothetical protein